MRWRSWRCGSGSIGAMAVMVATPAADLGCTQNHPYRMVGGPPGEWHTVPVEPVTLETDYCQLYEDREGPYQRGDAVVTSVEWVQDDGVDVYKLGYVEIDDHGNQFNPAQLVKSLEALEPPSGPRPRPLGPSALRSGGSQCGPPSAPALGSDRFPSMGVTSTCEPSGQGEARVSSTGGAQHEGWNAEGPPRILRSYFLSAVRTPAAAESRPGGSNFRSS